MVNHRNAIFIISEVKGGDRKKPKENSKKKNHCQQLALRTLRE